MSRGGARPGAGRKTNAEITRVRNLIDAVVSDDDWKKVLANLLDIATTNKGYPAVQAAQLLCRYRFGVPPQETPEPEVIMGPIQFIEVDPNPAVRDDIPPDDDDALDDTDIEDESTNAQSPITQTPRFPKGARSNQQFPVPARHVPPQRQLPDVSLPRRPAPGVEQPRPVYRGPGGRPGR